MKDLAPSIRDKAELAVLKAQNWRDGCNILMGFICGLALTVFMEGLIA